MFFSPRLCQPARDAVHDGLGIAVHGSVGDEDAGFLRLVPAPQVVFIENLRKIMPPDQPVRGTDEIDRRPLQLAEQRLYLRAVAANDIGIIPPRLIHPIPFKIGFVAEQVARKRTEGAESVRRKEHAVPLLIGEHHFGPVHHGREREMQRPAAKGETPPSFTSWKRTASSKS